MTDGILLAETQQDRFLNQYDTLIIDEAHERSLNIDFLLGYVKRLLSARRDLKLIITSATIDAERFAAHFACERTGQPAPIIEVSGRAYPIEIRYQPSAAGRRDADDMDPQRAIADAVEELARTGPGDMLVFLPTERDIRETAKTLRGRSIPGDGRQTEILPLYARLSAAEQNKIFQPHGRRRIVLATNVAESSLTVPNIRFVIDTGTARISRYSPRRKVQRLPIEPVAQASADQRAGRCGRVGPGICVRLYSEDDYLARERYATPEIRRTNLAAVILQTKAFRLGAIEEFPFLDPPRSDAIQDGYRTLFELGAIDDRAGTDGNRPPPGPLAGRSADRPHDPGRCGRRLSARSPGHRLRPGSAGSARAAGGEAASGRRTPRPIRRSVVRLPELPATVELLPRLARKAVAQPAAESLPAELPVLQSDAGVARHPSPAEAIGGRVRTAAGRRVAQGGRPGSGPRRLARGPAAAPARAALIVRPPTWNWRRSTWS